MTAPLPSGDKAPVAREHESLARACYQPGQHIIPKSAANSPHATVWAIDCAIRRPGHEPRYYCTAPGFGVIGLDESEITLTDRPVSQFAPSQPPLNKAALIGNLQDVAQ